MREPKTFPEWVEANWGTVSEWGSQTIVTDKLASYLMDEREGLKDAIMGQQFQATAHRLFVEGFTPVRISVETERDAILGAFEVTAIAAARFEGDVPNYMALCYEMWNASWRLRQMNPLQFTWLWIKAKVRAIWAGILGRMAGTR